MNELIDLAAAFAGSEARLTMNSRHAKMFDKIAKHLKLRPKVEKLGGGSIRIDAPTFTKIVDKCRHLHFDEDGELVTNKNTAEQVEDEFASLDNDAGTPTS